MMISIFHNISRNADAGLNRPRRGAAPADRHPLIQVFTFTMPREKLTAIHDTEDRRQAICDRLLDIIYREFNVGTSELAAAYRARKLRSLSVGDVVMLDSRIYACEPAGWRRVTYDDLNMLHGLKADRAIRERLRFDKNDELTVTVPLPAEEHARLTRWTGWAADTDGAITKITPGSHGKPGSYYQ